MYSRIAWHAISAAWRWPSVASMRWLFTGGIGENSVRMRAMTLARLRPLGLVLDAAANALMTGGRQA